MTRLLDLAAPLLLLAATASGCAYSHAGSIRLPVSPQSRRALAQVVIEDARRPEDKETYVMGGKCVRAYGDDFIEPSKVEYLRALLAERLAPQTTLLIKLERFDTIERCQQPSELTGQVALTGARPRAAKGRAPAPPSTDSGEDFTLLLTGSANGVPFRFRRVFDYSDLHYFDFPADSAEYRARIARLFGEFAEALRKPPPAPAAVLPSEAAGTSASE
jgi:hypothetical protein